MDQIHSISERCQMIGRDRRKAGEVRHAQTLRLPPSTASSATYRARQERTRRRLRYQVPMRADRAGRRYSQFETLTDGRDLRDVTGDDDSSGERGESVEQLPELLVVQAVVGGEGHAVGAILDVVPHVLASGR
jgi:hypothetical protein